MTPKERAKDLVEKYRLLVPNEFLGMDKHLAKQCALIAVNEIMKVCPYIDSKIRETEDQLSAFDFQFVSYWEEVKQQIEKS